MKKVLILALILGAGLILNFGLAGAVATLCAEPSGADGCYTTIQAAVNAASSGDTIQVKPGTYSENVDINKSVSLVSNPGAQLDGTGLGGDGFLVNAADVVIDGFEISNFTNAVKSISGPSNLGNLSVLNSALHDNTNFGVFLAYDSFDDVLIENSQIYNTTAGKGVGVVLTAKLKSLKIKDSSLSDNLHDGLNVDDSSIEDLIIQDSDLAKNTWEGILFRQAKIGSFDMQGGSLSDNGSYGLAVIGGSGLGALTIAGVGVENNAQSGLFLGGESTTDELQITKSTFKGNKWEDIDLSGGWFGPFSVTGKTKIAENKFLNGGAWAAVYLGDVASFGTTPAINQNDLINYQYGIYNNSGILVDGEDNWWGACDGPAGVGPGSGSGVSAGVDYDPWTGCDGMICGTKFEDMNANGIRDFDTDKQLYADPGLADWQINIKDLTTDQVQSVLTDEQGEYCFEGLDDKEYRVYETQGDGWAQTWPLATGGYDVQLTINEIIKGQDFGNFKLGEIQGFEYEDLNINGVWDVNEPTLENWQISSNGDKTASLLTSENGAYSFGGLLPGIYTISEEIKPYWYQSEPQDPSTYQVVVSQSGQTFKDLNFGNYKLAEIRGRKYQDLNLNGQPDQDEPGLKNWSIELLNLVNGQKREIQTDNSGEYAFEDLQPGKYIVREKLRLGWVPINPTSSLYTVQILEREKIWGLDFGNNTVVGSLRKYKLPAIPMPLFTPELPLIIPGIGFENIQTGQTDSLPETVLPQPTDTLSLPADEVAEQAGSLLDISVSQQGAELLIPDDQVLGFETVGKIGLKMKELRRGLFEK